jgi:hypothetical protein
MVLRDLSLFFFRTSPRRNVKKLLAGQGSLLIIGYGNGLTRVSYDKRGRRVDVELSGCGVCFTAVILILVVHPFRLGTWHVLKISGLSYQVTDY